MLQFESFVFNPFAENTYVVYDDGTKECVIIDPGCDTIAAENQLFGYIDSHRLKPILVINTTAISTTSSAIPPSSRNMASKWRPILV